ncbi:MAG: hypothetical protein LBH28_02545 [Oscillospiraceae bacterium]|jgi:hypothetical protein|nr:hypothetical protein [Oscillospiraceae bacterium]
MQKENTLDDYLSRMKERGFFCSTHLHSKKPNRDAVEIKGDLPDYWCCKRRAPYVKDCGTGGEDPLQCANCKLVVAKYVLYDILKLSGSSEEKYFIGKDAVIASYELFKEFQTNHISSLFIGEYEFVKFNTYVIFVLPDIHSSLLTCDNKSLILEDLDYSRKLFFTFDELEEYFETPNDLRLSLKDNDSETFSERITDKIRFVFNSLRSRNMWTILADDSDEAERVDLLRKHIYANACSNNPASCKDSSYDSANAAFDESDYNEFIQIGEPDHNNSRGVLRSAVFDHYRTGVFGKNPRSFDFKLMNMVYANNREGKTSLLDGIAYALSGEDTSRKHEDGVECSIIIGTDQKTDEYKSSATAKDLRNIKKSLYPKQLGNLYDLFTKVNYFPIDASLLFAQKERDGGKLLRLLFSNNNFAKSCERIIWLYNLANVLHNEFREVLPPKIISSAISELKKRNSGEVDQKEIESWQAVIRTKKKAAEYCLDLAKNLDIPVKEMENEVNLKEYYSQVVARIEKMINKIYRKLHSFDEEIRITVQGEPMSPKMEIFFVKLGIQEKDESSFTDMSAAQRTSIVLAIMFAQFLESSNAPNFVILDEPMSNLDDLHLLNLFDFLRELVLQEYQVILAATRIQTAEIAAVKFQCLNNEKNINGRREYNRLLQLKCIDN